MRPKFLLVLFTLLTVLATGFIWSNSLKDSKASYVQSDAIMEIVEPILTPVIRQDTEEATEKKLSFVVRKAAHFVEFAALGICAGGFVMSLSAPKKRSFWLFGPVICLVVAGCDEYIQSFTDRTSSLKDVALDMCGSITGLLVVAIVVFLWKRRKELKT